MAYRVFVLDSQQSFEVAPDEPVLDAALRAGVALAHECRFGGCGTCRIQVLEGAVRYDEPPMGLEPDDEAAGFALACQARAQSDLVIAPARAGEACAEPVRHQARVLACSALSPDVTHLRLALPDGVAPDYRPGQYLRVFLEDGGTRSFSMAGAPGGEAIDLHVRRIPGGRFTDQLLAQVRAEHTFEVELPHGSFFYRAQDYRPLVMVATGTGLAPIKSILESLMDDPDCPPVSLYWGGRRPEDLYLDAEIASWGERLYDFRYVPVLSRAGEGWTGRRGYVQAAVAEDLSDLSEHALYLCGSPEMIRDARESFLARGASAAHVYTDSFTFQRA